MPYKTNADLPGSVKDALPGEAQTVFRNVFNANEDKGEESAIKIAWTAVKNGWEKDEDGKWVKKDGVNKGDTFSITKTDGDRNLVFGWANVAFRVDGEQIEDHQEDIVDIEELEDAAYQFVLTFRETGVMHQGEAVGHLIESFVVTPEKLERLGLAPDALPLAWWIGFHIESDEVFAKVKSGEYKMFSIQGKAVREEVVT